MTDSTEYLLSSVVFTVISSTAVAAEVIQDQPTFTSAIIHVGLKGDKGDKGDRGQKGEVGDVNPLTIFYLEQAEAAAQAAGSHATSANTDRIAAESARSEANTHKESAEIAALTSASKADEAAVSAAAAATFNPELFVPRAGGIEMGGPLSVPPGAGGTEVPQAQEVVLLTGNQNVAGVKTFSNRPKVPSGATQDEVPQAQEIFGKSQSLQPVTRLNNTTYTNTTGKPIVLYMTGVTANAAGFVAIAIDGLRVAMSSYASTGNAAIGCVAVVPPGLTYAVTWGDMSSTTAREYR